MKLPFKRDTATAIAKAREALTAAEGKAASLTAEREALLLAEDGFDRLWSVDKQIAEAAAQAQTRRDQIAALEAVQVEEARQARQRDRAAAIGRVEAALPARLKAMERLEKAVKDVAVAVEALVEIQGTMLRGWPSNLEPPWSIYVGLDHAERAVLESFSSWAPEMRRWGLSIQERAQRIRTGISGLAAGEGERHTELLEHLRAQPAPEPVMPEPDDEAVAA